MNLPSVGFYYHYKHDPNGEINNYAYEVLGVGHHTENDCREVDRHVVVYRPLYESFVYQNGQMFDIRPLNLFTENVAKDGEDFPRFRRITDDDTIQQLLGVKERMYKQLNSICL